MNPTFINKFTYVAKDGEKVLAGDFLPVWCVQNQGVFEIDHYEWVGDGKVLTHQRKHGLLVLVPDASGFLCFEGGYVPNNCTLLDAYGKERMRLSVPWQLTTANNPASNAPPTCFVGTSESYPKPADGKVGKFGVKAWVEYAGEYYFELDWKTGKFLWGREIRF